MASLTMKLDNRPDGDPIELPGVGLFNNGELTTLSDEQVASLKLMYNIEGKAIVFPLKPDLAEKVVLNLTGEVAGPVETPVAVVSPSGTDNKEGK